MTIEEKLNYGTFEATVERSLKLEEDLIKNPQKYRVLTGDRPTGRLHIGHLFGSLQNRVRLHRLGVQTFIVIADYQVLTDRDTFEHISENIKQLTIDYIAAGIDPESDNVCIFPHSHVPELNQLLLPFLTLVTMAELDRNPTVKEEIAAAGLKRINAGMYTYPVHQAADILFCKGNVVPVGKDQLPHLELTRTIARRFNERFAQNMAVFPEPQPLLSKAPLILGLDGSQKMSKSRNNAIMLSATEDETAQLIKKAKTDAQRQITYDRKTDGGFEFVDVDFSFHRRGAGSHCGKNRGRGGAQRKNADRILNDYLRPLRAKRKELEANMDYVGTY